MTITAFGFNNGDDKLIFSQPSNPLSRGFNDAMMQITRESRL